MVSDAAAVVCAAPVDEVGDGALDVVGLSVGQSCLRMDSEDTLPALQDERSVMSFLVRPVAVLISQFFYRTMIVVMIFFFFMLAVCLFAATHIWWTHLTVTTVSYRLVFVATRNMHRYHLFLCQYYV